MRGLTRWLIRRAARGAPPSLAARLEEEWLADLGGRTGAISRLRWALGCCWATQAIAHDFRSSGVALAAEAMGAKLAIPHPYSGFHSPSRRSMTLVLVIVLHVAACYGLMTSLKFNVPRRTSLPLQNQLLPEPHPRDLRLPLPPPPTASMNRRLEIPTPEFPSTSDTDDRVAVVPEKAEVPTAASTPVHVVSVVPGGPGKGFPSTEDFYPSAAKRMEEQGITTVHVCVDPNGRLTAAPITAQSSGSSRLDEGALQLAKAASGHYRASTEDGRPVNSCYAFRVRFELRN